MYLRELTTNSSLNVSCEGRIYSEINSSRKSCLSVEMALPSLTVILLVTGLY